MTDDSNRSAIPPASGEELVIVDGKVAADFPAAPEGVRWSTYGLDVAPPPPKRGILPAAALTGLVVGTFLLGVLPVDATNWPTATLATFASIHVILVAGALGYRSRAFASVTFGLSIVLAVLAPIVLLVTALVNSTPQSTGDLGLIGTTFMLSNMLLTTAAVIAFIASFKRRDWPRGLVISAGVLVAVAVLGMVVASVITQAVQGVNADVPAAFHAYWIPAVQLLVLPASAALVGIRNPKFKLIASALLVLTVPPVLVPIPVGFTLTHLVVPLPFISAAVAAVFSARRFTETTHYGDPARRLAS